MEWAGNMTNIKFYGKENLSKLLDSNYAADYIYPLIANGSSSFIQNVLTKSYLLQANSFYFPVTINNTEYDNSYVCSPYTACISYAKEELAKLNNKPLEYIFSLVISLMGVLFKVAKINKVVSVNNWFLSTNLYPDWEGNEIDKITQYLKVKFPKHCIMFRSLNEYTNSSLLNNFQQFGYRLIPSRQVYIFDGKHNNYLKKHNTKIDLGLLAKSSYIIVEHEAISISDYPRIVELYNKLYLDKYSYHNPQFTEAFIELWHKKKLLHMQGLRNSSGILDGVVGYFDKNGTTTAPLVGYDTALPQSLGLYRMLIAMVMKRAYDKGLLLNLSSGAAHFKRLRGGIAEIEYSAIYISHLPFINRVIWRVLGFLLTYIGIPVMKRFKL